MFAIGNGTYRKPLETARIRQTASQEAVLLMRVEYDVVRYVLSLVSFVPGDFFYFTMFRSTDNGTIDKYDVMAVAHGTDDVCDNP
jgi:hypothetical protein